MERNTPPVQPRFPLLEPLLASWDRHNTVLLNLLGAIPKGGLAARAMAGSPTVGEMFTHMHHERMISVFEEVPEFAGSVPGSEWVPEMDASRIAAMLEESRKVVRAAVQGRVEAERPLDLHFDHPILLLQFLLSHEAYHHGQIKLALKAAGQAISDEQAGPLIWDVWRARGGEAPPLSNLLLLGTLSPFRNAYLLRGLVVWIAVRLVLAFGGVVALAAPVAGVLVIVIGVVVWLDARRRAEELFLGNLGIPGWTIGVMATPLVLLAEMVVP